MDERRRAEIEEEERVREEARQELKAKRAGEWILWIVLVVAPLVNLVQGRTSWPYWVWAGVSWFIALVLVGRKQEQQTARE